MGMAASQINFLGLTRRKNDIASELQSLSLQKMATTREAQRISKNYQNALTATKYQWSNNGGASYTDLSYSNLMRPSSANQNTPYLITNMDGKVVLDSKYEKYAKMLSPDGKSGGDWTSVRTEILSDLTGIPADKLNNANTTNESVNAAVENVEKLKAEGECLKEPVNSDTASEFFERAGTIVTDNKTFDIESLYNSASSWINLGGASAAQTTLTNLLNGIAQNMSKFLTEEDAANFTEACNTYMTEYGHFFGSTSESDKQALENGTMGIKYSKYTYSVNLKTVLDTILGSYKSASQAEGLDSFGQNDMGTEVFYTRDKESTEWKEWKEDFDAWQTEYDAAIDAYNAAVDTDNQATTAEEENNIKFYDQLFSAIAEKGWVVNSQVQDNDYLNNMLQNNQYFITTIVSDVDEEGNLDYEYNTDLASNCSNIVKVNDTDAQNAAQIQYEYEKSIVSEKETRIDTRMENLQTELSSINEMAKSVENVREENNERTMNIFA